MSATLLKLLEVYCDEASKEAEYHHEYSPRELAGSSYNYILEKFSDSKLPQEFGQGPYKNEKFLEKSARAIAHNMKKLSIDSVDVDFDPDLMVDTLLKTLPIDVLEAMCKTAQELTDNKEKVPVRSLLKIFVEFIKDLLMNDKEYQNLVTNKISETIQSSTKDQSNRMGSSYKDNPMKEKLKSYVEAITRAEKSTGISK